MDAHKLLLADSNEDFLTALAEILSPQYQVFTTRSGKEALHILQREQCGVMILDLMLTELDGISLLEQAVALGLNPKVLVMTPLFNDYIQSAAERLGVAYLVYKPCDLQAVANRISDLSHGLRLAEPVDPHSQIRSLLTQLSVSAKYRGCRYLMEAIYLMAQDSGQSVTKELYPAVAQICNCDSSNVERSIRSVLDVAWKKRQPSIWECYFPLHKKRPTNAEFISRLAEMIRL